MQRRRLAARPHTLVFAPALQEWLPVEALPELVAEIDAPLSWGAERPRSRRKVG
jgi:hypothetical protein